MAIAFIVELHPSGDNRRRLRRRPMLRRVWNYLQVGWKFRLRGRGGEWSTWGGRLRTMGRVTFRLGKYGDGDKLFIQRYRDREQLSVHKVITAAPVPDLGCHPDIEKAYASLIRRYGADSIRNGGTYNCRFVDQSRTLSRHGYKSTTWKGAAGDIFSNPDTMSSLNAKADFLVHETFAGRLRIDRLIVGNMYWSRSDGLWRKYTGSFHRHIHIEVYEGFRCM